MGYKKIGEIDGEPVYKKSIGCWVWITILFLLLLGIAQLQEHATR